MRNERLVKKLSNGGILGNYIKDENLRKEYNVWYKLLFRALKHKHKWYKDCILCDEWKEFAIFQKWLRKQENYNIWSKSKKREFGLDKDILVKGNKIYSPATCCLVPREINIAIAYKRVKKTNLPNGVYYDNRRKINKYYITISENGKQKHLGSWKTKEEAFYQYRTLKERVLKELAQKHYNLGNITKQCYEVMMKYKIEMY